MSDRLLAPRSARGSLLGSVATHAVLVAGSVAMIGPFVWQVLTALKSQPETATVPPTLLPREWLWSNFADVFATIPFGTQLVNSLVVAGAVTIGQLAFCSLGAYAFARLEFRGRERSEERRVGKECRARRGAERWKKKR